MQSHKDIIIERFGGVRPMARKLGHKSPGTVQGWLRRGVIPIARWPEIAAAASQHGIAFDMAELMPGEGA